MSLERTVISLVQRLEKHFYGKYRGVVVDNEDPEQLGRLKVSVPSVLGPEVVTGWAMPCMPYGGAANQGFLFIPEVDAGVWIEFEEGDLEFPIWTGTYWTKPDGESELPLANDAEGEETEIQNPVTSKIIKTLRGHTIQLEDAEGEERITILQKSDDGINLVVMDATGIVVKDYHGNSFEMLETGMVMTDLTGNIIEMSDSAFNITSAVAMTIDASGQAFEVKADAISLTKA